METKLDEVKKLDEVRKLMKDSKEWSGERKSCTPNIGITVPPVNKQNNSRIACKG